MGVTHSVPGGADVGSRTVGYGAPGVLKFTGGASDNTSNAATRGRPRSRTTDEGGPHVLDDPGHESEQLDHPNIHIAALFDGALQFSREMIDAWDDGQRTYVQMRSSWVQVVLADLAQRVGWGTGTIGLQIAAILGYLSQRLDADARSRDGLVVFVGDLTTVYGLWSMICGHSAAPRTAELRD